MRGSCSPGNPPDFTNASLWQMPQAWTLIRTEAAFGSGIGRSTTSNGPPALETWTAFIFLDVSAMIAPSLSLFDDVRGREHGRSAGGAQPPGGGARSLLVEVAEDEVGDPHRGVGGDVVAAAVLAARTGVAALAAHVRDAGIGADLHRVGRGAAVGHHPGVARLAG